MSTIYQGVFPRSLTTLCADIEKNYQQDDHISAWLFDDKESLQAAQKTLRDKGYQVSFYRALKPLVYFFETLQNRDTLRAVTIAYPIVDHCEKNRFLLEAYPLAAWFGDLIPNFIEGDNTLYYSVQLDYKDGSSQQEKIFAPNHQITDWGGQSAFTPCAWLKVERQGNVLEDKAILSEMEQIYQDVMRAITQMPLAPSMPFFEELAIDVTLPQQQCALGYDDEVISFQEMLHEEFYFSTLEYFQKISGLPSGDRSIRPGQIAPNITTSTDDFCHVNVSLRALNASNSDGPITPLANAHHPLDQRSIAAALSNFNGVELTADTRSGRLVKARYIKGSDCSVMISACQHGNETTGSVGALLAGQHLVKNPNAHFILSPLENPDGNALFLRLIKNNPHHMHHAARYTASGNDLQNTPDSAPMERAIRIKGRDISAAKLHINLHGYPSHEWIRPFSGYIPRNFAMWTLPKGFFIVFRYQENFESIARALAEKVTTHLGQVPGLLDLNQRQIALYGLHAGELGFEMIHGIPCSFTCYPNAAFAVELVTEYPDETIYDDAFTLGQQTQMETVVSAYEAWQTLMNKA